MRMGDYDGHNEEENALSPLAIGYIWSTRIISLSIEMGLIILGFLWLDKKLGTTPIFMIFGSMLGIGVFIVQLIALIKPITESLSPKRKP